MTPYKKYKASGIEWIGDIPENWEVKKFKYLFDLITEKADDEFKIGLENIESWTGRFIETKSVFQGAGVKFEEGDILYGKLRPYLAKVLKSKSTGSAVGDIFVFRSNDAVLADYGFRLVLNHSFISITDGSTYGAKMPRVSWDFISNLPIPLPPFEEQTPIAQFLDQKTAEIDTAIAHLQQLIQLQKEERNSLINEAVTKGINPQAPLKASGIEWAFETAEHWKKINLRYLTDVTTGDKDTENREDEAEFPFFVRSQTIERISTYTFDGEAILTAGDGVGVCKVWHYINGKFDYHQRVYMMSNFRQITGKFLFYFLKSNFIYEVLKLSAKSTVDSLRRNMFLDFPVLVPPLEEQTQIVAYIEKETKRIDTEIQTSAEEIKLLKEYKQALITEAVTGKIDVRTYKL